MEATPPMRRTHRNVALLMLGGLVLFVLVAFNSYQTLRAMETATHQRASARESLLASSTLLSVLKDVETGQRGYILTGNPIYLAPYETGLALANPAFVRLAERVAHLPAVSRTLLDTRGLLEQRLALAQRNVEARKREGFDAAQRLVLSDEGHAAMDAIRAQFLVIERLLRDEIAQRNAEVIRLKRQAFWAEGALSLLGVLLIVGSYMLVLREQKRRMRAESALRDANAELEAAVVARTAELERARSEIEAFAQRLDQSIEAERRRLAREVHDQLGQVFTALKMTLNHSFQNAADYDAALVRMNALLVDGIATARRIAGELRPPLLDDLGLGAALRHRAQRFAEETGVACEVALEHDDRLRPDQATQLYRIVQEALTNVARHAGAHQVWIAGQAGGGYYELAVEDDGRGMAADATIGSLGLLSMRERAALAGGTLAFGPGRTGGLRMQVRLPLAHPQEEFHAHPDH